MEKIRNSKEDEKGIERLRVGAPQGGLFPLIQGKALRIMTDGGLYSSAFAEMDVVTFGLCIGSTL